MLLCLASLRHPIAPQHGISGRHRRQNHQGRQPAGERRHLGAEPSSDETGLELPELWSIAGENAVDRRHAAAQFVGRAQLIDGRAQDRTDGVAGVIGIGIYGLSTALFAQSQLFWFSVIMLMLTGDPASAPSYRAKQCHADGGEQRADGTSGIEQSESCRPDERMSRAKIGK